MHPLAGAYWLTSLSPRGEGQPRVCRDRGRPVYKYCLFLFLPGWTDAAYKKTDFQ